MSNLKPPIEVTQGGTGVTTITGVLIGNGTSNVTGNTVTNHNLLVGGSSNAITSVAPSATTGVAVVSQGAAADPAFGTVVVAGGGTGATTAAGARTNLGINSGILTWTEVTGTSQAMAVNNGYIANNGSLVSLSLPTTAAVGDVVAVSGKGAGSFRITQAASQQIFSPDTSSTSGAGGYVDANTQYGSIELVCITANNIWEVRSCTSQFTTDVGTPLTPASKITKFTGNGTWNKDPRTKIVQLILWSGGSGGGSGRKGTTITNKGGGSGGSNFSRWITVQASVFVSSNAVTIGTGGTGGAPQSGNSQDGNPGNPGVATSVGSFTTLAPTGGGGGTTTNQAGGAGAYVSPYARTVQTGAQAGSNGTAGSPGGNLSGPVFGASVGGGAGGVTSTGTVSGGGAGGGILDSDGTTVLIAGGLAGGAGADGGNGNPGNLTFYITGGTGGGGGGAYNAVTVGKGGNGGIPGGAGGGGGAGIDSVSNSGAWIFEYF